MILPIRPEDYGDPNWCPDCGEPRGVCNCEEEDGEPDFTLDDLEWDEAYPEFAEDDDICCVCGRYFAEGHAISCSMFGIVP